ncbi:MAG: hypothetical protein A2729_03035 [Candidatus Buchananbacteria bacterium RIFCSPHIGHO2_01_FULL_39_14]|uniref:Bacterial type II secretion system protein E domain-containing protein n=2 Tax=Candidatus Buchananiibacteriota TaxID=1817903 RepID=A0A1G1YX40_9BACT|nr:MAG: hypothetical protein A2729_03035 [Candidatus Buchananbacteria bacterium RIFCSPHIGHO2_01_FULL_39_14]OGY49005.1 MAG: hypothetical protein A3D39_01380 [Candidatus Buchananbacteria bacterium RIFCSPHIGHO2_02_FULL_39_17]OGY55967.1 MAG: hypothetical protein A2912_03225 [Candidatus Buchananbacteria bacterium RIFCSPLOWO2_01_FULL_40_23b]
MDSSINVIINNILTTAAKRKASYIHLTVGAYPALRIDDQLVELKDEAVVINDLIKKLADGWLEEDQKKELTQNKEMILVKEIDKKFRLKIHFFFQKGNLSAIIHLISSQIPPLANLGLPKSITGLVEKKSGLIIIAGSYGSGKTTTVSALIEEINKNRKVNIVTIEKPTEYIFTNQQSIVEQRQVGTDVVSFKAALDSVQKTDIDVVCVSENNEADVIPLVLEVAVSGRLVILTMTTLSAVQTLEEILASFKSQEKNRALTLVADSLLAVIVQRLVPKVGGGLILAAEILFGTEAVQSLIREGKVKQITTVLQSSRAEGMISLDQSLAELVKNGVVQAEEAEKYALDPEIFHPRR